MARKFGRLHVSTWDDSDYTSLTCTQQQVYNALYSSRDISWCGVLPLLPQRLAGLASDLTLTKVRAALSALDRARFVVVDEATAEICVRRFIHHDEVMAQPNVAKAMGRALSLVHSEKIRQCIIDELTRESDERPDLGGWASLAAAYPELSEEVHANPWRKGYRKGSGKGCPTNPQPSTYNPQPTTPDPTGAASPAGDATKKPVTSVGGQEITQVEQLSTDRASKEKS